MLGVKCLEGEMKKMALGSSFAIFVLFFGIAMLDAFQTRN
jgi:hypothetical protein